MTRNKSSFRMRTLETYIHTEEVPFERTVHHCSVQPLNRGCTMYPIKLHVKLWPPKDRSDPKEDINFL